MRVSALVAALGVAFSMVVAPAQADIRIFGPATATRPVMFDVVLPLRHKDQLEALLKALQDPASSQYHRWLTPAIFAERFGSDAAVKRRIASYLGARGFKVRIDTRSLRVSGTAGAVSRTFGIHLMVGQSETGATSAVAREIPAMPAALALAGAKVFSFIPHAFHRASHVVTGPLALTRNARSSRNRNGDSGGYWFDDLKQAYHYPSETALVKAHDKTMQPFDGTGVTIAALMSSDVLDSDIKAYFDQENWSTITGKPDPALAGRVYVDGGAGFGGDESVEASLDVQQELGSAPGAKVWLYDIPDLSDDSVFAGYVDIDEDNAVDVVSSSIGGCELYYTAEYNGGIDYTGILVAYDELFMQGNAEGITFLAASDDLGGKECVNLGYFEGKQGRYVVGVSRPADDPHVTAVGGTNLVTTFDGTTLDSSYVGENAWSDPFQRSLVGGLRGGNWGAGGGASAFWPAPDYQAQVATGTTMRAMPDIGMQMGGCYILTKLYHHECNGGDNPLDGNGNAQRSYVFTAFAVGSGGGFYGVVGTSAASPEFAGVVALLVERNGRMGNLNYYIYNLAAAQAAGGTQAYHTGIQGYNGVVNTDVSSTFSLSVGVGTPVVTGFVGKPNIEPAGVPQTVSNP